MHVQLVMTIKDGGICIRRVSSLALPAFLASAASTLPLQADILANFVKSESHLQSYFSEWSMKFGDVLDALPPYSRFGTALVC